MSEVGREGAGWSAPDTTETACPSRQPRSKGRRLHGAVYHKLGHRIVSGEFRPGDLLADQPSFAAELDISRGTYREAIQMLVAKGLLETRPRSGTRVLPRKCWNMLDPDILAWASASQPDKDHVRELFELRVMVEPQAAALAAERRTSGELKVMKEALAAMRRHSCASHAGLEAMRDFHRAIFEAAHNDSVRALAPSIDLAVKWSSPVNDMRRVLTRNAIPDHVRVYESILAHDRIAAASAMTDLVRLALLDAPILTFE